MTKLVYGVGINDKTRTAFVDGKNVKEYDLWTGMLERCFSEKYQTLYPTYRGCNVSNNFINYSFMIGVKNKLVLVRLMKKEEVGVWIRICYSSVTKHILKPLVFLFLKR